MTTAARASLRLATALGILLAVGAAGAGNMTHAQFVDDSLPPLADLSITADFLPSGTVKWRLTVTNGPVEGHPPAAVKVVKVRITEDLGNGNKVTIWTIKGLSPRASAVWESFSASNLVTGPESVPLRLYAEIIETDPVEPPGFQYNNDTELWAMRHPSTGRTHFTNGDVSVGINITDRSPEAGGTTTFTVNAMNTPPTVGYPEVTGIYTNTQHDVQIRVSLSPGLDFDGNPQGPSGKPFVRDTVDPVTGVWEVGVLEHNALRPFTLTLPVAVSLTADSLDEIPLEERCLTAEVIQAVPWFALHHYKRENDAAMVCLGRDPPVLLADGEIALFHYADCVGETAYPCTTDDTVELVAKADRELINLPGMDRTEYATIHNGETFLQPETITVHVQDPKGRHNGKWRTGKTRYHTRFAQEIPGVAAHLSYLPRTYNGYTEAISDVEPKQRAGEFTILAPIHRKDERVGAVKG